MPKKSDQRGWGRLPPAARTLVTLRCDERELQATIVNISHAGLLLACAQVLPVGTAVRLDFAADDRGIQADAVVVRHARGDEAPGMALSLRRVRLEDRMTLDTLIERARRAGTD